MLNSVGERTPPWLGQGNMYMILLVYPFSISLL